MICPPSFSISTFDMKTIKIFLTIICAISLYAAYLSMSPFSGGLSVVEFDQDIGFWHKRNFSSYTNKTCYRTKYSFNEEGLPSNNYNYSNKKSDVAILGNSYIEAIMVKNENIIHNQLFKAIDGKYNVLNYALSSTIPPNHLLIFQNKVRKDNLRYLVHFIALPVTNYSPPTAKPILKRQLVQIFFEKPDKFKLLYKRDYNFVEKLRDFLGSTEYYFYVIKSINYIRTTLSDLESRFSKNDNADTKSSDKLAPLVKVDLNGWRQLKLTLLQLIRETKENNAQYLPVLYSHGQNGAEQQEKRMLAELFDEQGITYLDADEILLESGLSNISFSCDNHWNDDVHRYLSYRLSPYIK